MDNAAFGDDGNDGRSEAARILGVIARKLDDGTEDKREVFDVNGNVVGNWKIVGGVV